MNEEYLDKITRGDCRDHISRLADNSIELFLSDILTTQEGQVVLDPFMGSGTTAVAARRLNRHFIGFEIAPEFHRAALQRLDSECGTGDAKDAQSIQQMLFEKARSKYRS